MITNHYAGSLDRTAKLEEIKGMKIIDIGGANSFAHGYLDAVIDIRPPQASANHYFIGDICTPELWEKVLAHVKKHGKWQYAICSHTLEDIVNPMYAAAMISQIAEKGIVITPSKFREFGRFQGKFRGYMHHFWIFDMLEGKYTCWPKHNFIEDERFDRLPERLPDNEELVIEWIGEIGLEMINAGMPFGTATMSGEEHMHQLYGELLQTPLSILTVCDDPNHAGIMQLKKSLTHHGYDLDVIIAPFTFGSQMNEVYHWCKNQPADKRFLYTDAYDTFAMDGMDRLVKEIKSFNCEMIMSCEKACYPHPERAGEYPANDSEWKYVNGGGFTTTAGFFIQKYDERHAGVVINDRFI